jgi:transcriptional regulator with XRE-family HTH domain
MARRIGMARERYRNIENGTAYPTREEMIRLASEIGIPNSGDFYDSAILPFVPQTISRPPRSTVTKPTVVAPPQPPAVTFGPASPGAQLLLQWPWEAKGMDDIQAVLTLVRSLGNDDPRIVAEAERTIQIRVTRSRRWSAELKSGILNTLASLIQGGEVDFSEVYDLEDLKRLLERVGKETEIVVSDAAVLNFMEALSPQIFRSGGPKTPDTINAQPTSEQSHPSVMPVTVPQPPSTLVPSLPAVADSKTKAFVTPSRPDVDVVTAGRYAGKLSDKAQELFNEGKLWQALWHWRQALKYAEAAVPSKAEIGTQHYQERVDQSNKRVEMITRQIETVQGRLTVQIHTRTLQQMKGLGAAGLSEAYKNGELADFLVGRLGADIPTELKEWASGVVWQVIVDQPWDQLASYFKGSTASSTKVTYRIYIVKGTWVKKDILFADEESQILHPTVQTFFDRFFLARAIGGNALTNFTLRAPLNRFNELRIKTEPRRRVIFRIFDNGGGRRIVIVAARIKNQMVSSSSGDSGAYSDEFDEYMKPFAQEDDEKSIQELNSRATPVNGLELEDVTKTSLAVSSWFWDAINKILVFFRKTPLSLSVKARRAFWAEQVLFTGVALGVLLPGALAMIGVWSPEQAAHILSPVLLGSMAITLVLIGLFGASHTRLVQRKGDEVFEKGVATWSHKFNFMRWAASWQGGLLAAPLIGLLMPRGTTALLSPVAATLMASMILLSTGVALYAHYLTDKRGRYVSSLHASRDILQAA